MKSVSEMAGWEERVAEMVMAKRRMEIDAGIHEPRRNKMQEASADDDVELDGLMRRADFWSAAREVASRMELEDEAMLEEEGRREREEEKEEERRGVVRDDVHDNWVRKARWRRNDEGSFVVAPAVRLGGRTERVGQARLRR